ncbi:aminoacyl-tRNA hydrolase [Verrucomicrobiaceae bacterium N1E253]|uniref:Peptidyl-tRNA hydrolase n=1 Tax=Oceaniferula marina TaxID=2748318 RepID=A0A851GM39_9BACT|nr:aminoacyl-tRNA hydrolase [Oceaniferula marina]NWK55194.1 aminoacyl-tRNA hydrolase [Oceaniferula marina]
MSDIKLVVGLGNPGAKYEQTRHNIGFLVVDRLVGDSGCSMSNHLRWRAHVAKLPGLGTILMKPQTFMNESGQSVGAAVRFYKLEPEQVLVVYDDVSLPFGARRFRMSGSAGGHNGMKSIISHLGSDRFPRLKLGIGMDSRPAELAGAEGEAAKNKPGGSLVGHVLGKFSVEERNELENTLATAAEAVQFALSEGVEAAANAFNTKKKA